VVALHDATISETQEALGSGEVTAVELCQHHLDRIEAIDRSGPTLRAVLEVSPAALDHADICDRARGSGDPVPPLLGIPILVKDSIDTADGMMTSAGSLAMLGYAAARDAFVVDRLRRAGAVIMGKSSMTEWSSMRSARTCSGWSSRGGQIRNPHVLDRTPSGSSRRSGCSAGAV
jgi:amidase